MSVAKFTSAYNLPESHIRLITTTSGVDAATPILAFSGYYQDPKFSFQSFAAYPKALLQVFINDYQISDVARAKFLSTRIGMLATQPLADKFGWSVGDRIVLESQIYAQKDGSRAWEFELVGLLSPMDERPIPPTMFFDYAYFDEASRVNQSTASYFLTRVQDHKRVSEVSRAIDIKTSITPQPTRTVTREHMIRNIERQLGDVGQIIIVITGAVLFTMLLVTGHSAAQSILERRREHATLLAIGFSHRWIGLVVFAEQLALCVISWTFGITIAILIEPTLNQGLVGNIGDFSVSVSNIAVSGVVAFVGAIAISAAPIASITRLYPSRDLALD